MIWKDGVKGNVKDKKGYCQCVNKNEPIYTAYKFTTLTEN